MLKACQVHKELMFERNKKEVEPRFLINLVQTVNKSIIFHSSTLATFAGTPNMKINLIKLIKLWNRNHANNIGDRY